MQIYFFSIIIEGITYVGVDLENILNEIHANRQQLCIDLIKKKTIEFSEEKPELTTAPEMPLQVFMATHYKPTAALYGYR